MRKALDSSAAFRGFWFCCRLDRESPADIGHVDFLEMVYKQAERPYVIVGLHFDQVRRACLAFTSQCC